ncbi:conserved hypothetical protein [Flavobacterium sp. 9AF]|uniref:DUF5908 family protein n=1 Tax=Flavobacterium sp. 9AF TaxID=2653142 RepID=UPI0012F35D41|nr:DUF5908 family protein [Flavobacterium sp. 9AF]VXB30301.1 conserved hypothetical protein [Flavobacterium sp. 9AF]
MPIEIKELHIKINVNESSTTSSKGDSKSKDTDLVGECVDQVMKVIERKKER